MQFVQNFPFFAILMYLASGVICSVLKPRAAKYYCLTLNAVICFMMLATLLFSISHGEAYVYLMGHFPAPWGNEIRIGILEALMATSFAAVMLLSLMGGMEHIFEDVEPDKINLYFTVICLLMSSMMALIYTNDLFNAYVFVEINTIASCALVMVRYNSGKPLVATIRYLCMSLIGSSLFLMGIVILYSISGHLLMENIQEAVANMAATGQYRFPLTVVVGLFAVGLAMKSALYPFHSWLPEAHGSATASSSAILSGLVLKSYIILLIKIFYRVIGLAVIHETKVYNCLFLFGAMAMIFGSVRAIQEKDLKRMLAYSSVAQIGYVFLGIGMATTAGFVAACIQILAHAFTKPMLFCASGGFMTASSGSKQMNDITGAAFRDPLGGLAFLTGSLSMIGIPFFASFNTKLSLTTAAVGIAGHTNWKMVIALATIVLSTILNALYYLPVVGNIYSTKKNIREIKRIKYEPGYVISMVLFIALNIGFGLSPALFSELITKGLEMFG